jgi:hypothetical protein
MALASTNLFPLLGLSILRESAMQTSDDHHPRLILSEHLWRSAFGADPAIFGRTIRLQWNEAIIAGVAPTDADGLPGQAEAWIQVPDAELRPTDTGYVVGRLAGGQFDDNSFMSARRPDGSMGEFRFTSLAERLPGTWRIFLFAVFLACLALPATTSLPLGEYRASSHKTTWSTRLRRWVFLACKLALLLPIVYVVPIDLAYVRVAAAANTPVYIQLVCGFCICLFGMRWMLRDQRQRCPVCLGKLTHPARVGQPSRSFLAWNGTELICVGGHGLLHVPEINTSWFDEQRWLYLDPSWKVLFANEGMASAGYF